MVTYIPISCGLHSAFELACIQHRRLLLQLADGEQMEGVAMDVSTRDGAEYLLLRLADGAERGLRLDKLLAVQLADSGEWLLGPVV